MEYVKYFTQYKMQLHNKELNSGTQTALFLYQVMGFFSLNKNVIKIFSLEYMVPNHITLLSFQNAVAFIIKTFLFQSKPEVLRQSVIG